jgi:predicted transcriptional regulator
MVSDAEENRMPDQNSDLAALTAEIVAAFVVKNHVAPTGVAELITATHRALSGLGSGAAAEPDAAQEPAVSVRKSVGATHLFCLEDGKPFKSLRRHLQAEHGMTPAEYRAKWKLPASYPMVHPDYAESRRSLAMSMGLGRKPGGRESAPEPQAAAASPEPAKARAPRKPKAGA